MIVPFFNAGAYIRACVESLLTQSLPPEEYEILMVDNNSTDSSAAIVREYDRVKLLAETRQGSYAARNRGVAEARGRLLAFTDPDCVAAPGWLASFRTALAQPGVLVGLGARRPAREGSLAGILADYEDAKARFVLASDEKTVYFGFTNNMAVGREAFDRHGPFVERRRGADTIFVRRVVDSESCGAVVFVPGAEVRHLELDGVASYCRKMFTYGRSRQLYRHIARTRALRFGERFRIVRKTVLEKQYSTADRVRLAAGLGLGGAAWVLGSWTGALTPARPA